MPLNLSSKALALVLVPLVFQIAFAAAIFHMLLEAETAERRVIQAKEIHADLDVIMNSVLTAARSLGQLCLLGGNQYDQQYRKAVAPLEDTLHHLRALVGGEPGRPKTSEEKAALKAVDKLDHIACDVRKVCDAAVADLEDGNRVGAIDKFTSLKKVVNKLTNEVDSIRAEAQKVESEDPLIQLHNRENLKIACLIALGLNLLVAALVTISYNRSTTRRLNVLMDNTERLAQGRQLNPPPGGSDELARLDGVFRDMAEALSAASQHERAMLDRLATILNILPVGLMLIDEDGTIQMSNPSSEGMFQLSKGDIAGKNIMLLLSHPEGQSPENFMAELKKKSSGIVAEGEGMRQGGTSFPVEISLTAYSQSGNNDLYLLVLSDITQRKEIERLKREFMQMVSHDLRTPLTSIQIFLNLLLDGVYGELSEKIRQKAAVADRSAARLINLVSDLLDMERMESGQLRLSSDIVQISSVIERSLESVRPFAEQQGITLSSRRASAEVFADQNRLVQVLINLLSNAIKFSPPGRSVDVSVTPESEWIEVAVCDQGRGVPASMQEDIFQRFKQVELKDATEKKGSGLGLAICKVIIEQHGGKIGVRSQSNKGSTFWFRLPVVRKISIAAADARQSVSREYRKPTLPQ